LSWLVRAHRRSLGKVARQIDEQDVDWELVFSLRLAALFCRSRSDAAPPSIQVRRQGKKFRLSLGKDWLRRNPLTATALLDEVREWDAIGYELKIPELEEIEIATDIALAS
jgi:exopolyphosphatase/guanosine-5'-triphosphate,3'-diphosphate pyrophosphatase